MSATLEEIRERLHRARALRVAEAEPFVRAVRDRLPGAVAALRARFAVGRVLLFGSFARGAPHPGSDVDIAVERLEASEQFRAMALMSRELRHPVDLVRLEDLAPADRERLLREAEPA